ncbi:MAG: alpha/beta fold hydrolase [Actinomycetota bacterium]
MIEVDDGVQLWVECTGDGRGVPLVLCHGGPGLWDYLGPLAGLLDQDRLVVRWDQRGCGRSQGRHGPFTVDGHVADLDAIRTALGIDRWIVGGHSWGASLALRSVLTHPISAAGLLYLSGTGLGRSWHADYTAARRDRLTPEQFTRLEQLDALDHRTDAQEREWRTLSWAPDFAARNSALELASIDARAPWSINWESNTTINGETKRWDHAALLDACTRIAAPTLMLHGAQDPRPPYAIEDVARAIPSAEVRIVDDVGHMPWLERPGAVMAVVDDWLDRIL